MRVDQLMDREWPDEQRERFLAAAAEYPELAGLHDLRTRTSGTHHFAQFHVWVPADWTVREAHDRLDRGRGAAAGALSRAPKSSSTSIRKGQTDRETMLPSDLTEKAS